VKIVVGLGNPGREYEKTPHNIGFAVIDELARQLSSSMRISFRFRARLGKAIVNEQDLLLVKPQTYMNRSGTTTAAILRYKKVLPPDMILVLDDADLDFGRIRIRAGGSSGGHKGLESVIQSVGSKEFPRVRIGIGRSSDGAGLVEHVLDPFSEEEKRQMAEATKKAAAAILMILESGVDAAMNSFNSRNVD
jgi:peptidyl-tRNA hydrolase, PTH1 family